MYRSLILPQYGFGILPWGVMQGWDCDYSRWDIVGLLKILEGNAPAVGFLGVPALEIQLSCCEELNTSSHMSTCRFIVWSWIENLSEHLMPEAIPHCGQCRTCQSFLASPLGSAPGKLNIFLFTVWFEFVKQLVMIFAVPSAHISSKCPSELLPLSTH